MSRACRTPEQNAVRARKGHETRQARQMARTRERACLCCGALFRSEGPHNRMCDECRRDAGQMDVLGYEIARNGAYRSV